MKTQLYKLLIFSLFVIALGSCKKDTEMPTGEFVNLETHEAGTITAISAVVDAKAKASCTGRGVCWGKAPNPTIDDFHVANGSGKGEYSCSLTELEPNQKYYYRAYATDGERIAYALDEKSFTTKDGIVHLTTGYVTDITATSATCSGNIADDGGCPITERGFCWSTTPNPTLENNDLHIAAGSGTGEFSVALADLTPDATYYVRAYAISILGTTYADDEKDFVTRDGIPVVATSDICDITATSATCGGNITADGNCPVIERGICFGTSPNPTLENNAPHETLGDGIGEFSTTLTDLTPDMTYYVRAYAINSLGTTYAQDEKSFTTKDGIPVLITHDVSDITATSAKCSGNITDDGGFAVTERGFCWSTHPEPTLENNDPHIAAGSGTGEFSATITDLMPNTSYHIRAYATDSTGETYYAQNGKIFTTEDGLPSVTTGNVTDITTTSATCSGNVTDDGGFAVTECGFCWSTSPNPTLENNDPHIAAGSGTGEFSVTLTELDENTKYYVCAYATNSQGIEYGDEVFFSTPPVGAINCLFSINDDGDQVWFSKGNLQYRASVKTWRFAENQWDYVGNANSNISSSYDGWIDLFSWGTSGYDHGALAYMPTAVVQNNVYYYAYGDENYNLYDQTGKADWGYNAISNGGNAEHQWRTLTRDEWVYIIFLRTNASGIRYAKALVNNVEGVILVPDNWSTSTYKLNKPNNYQVYYTENVISSSAWNNTLEPAGCVFLPLAGLREGQSVYCSYGLYWSSSYCNNEHAYVFKFSGNQVDFAVWQVARYHGCSVRLVSDY